MSNESQSNNSGDLGCLGILAAAVLIAMGLWAYGFEPREAVGYGVAGAFGIFCGLPCAVLAGLAALVVFVAAVQSSVGARRVRNGWDTRS